MYVGEVDKNHNEEDTGATTDGRMYQHKGTKIDTFAHK